MNFFYLKRDSLKLNRTLWFLKERVLLPHWKFVLKLCTVYTHRLCNPTPINLECSTAIFTQNNKTMKYIMIFKNLHQLLRFICIMSEYKNKIKYTKNSTCDFCGCVNQLEFHVVSTCFAVIPVSVLS